MTLFEVMVVVAFLAILAAMLLPVFVPIKSCATRINCVSNIKQVNLSFRIWEGDNNNQYPMGVSVTNGGAMELIATGNVAGVFQVMSNELSTPKILVCPVDVERTSATNWNDLDASHISYFIGADVSNGEYPQRILDGDDDLVIAGKPVKSGLLEFSASLPVTWSGTRHGPGCGNIGLADGSVQEESSSGLETAIEYSTNGTGILTDRIAIP